MPTIKPYRAVRFTEKAGRIEDLVSPPYDVLKGGAREAFARKSPTNVVSLILPEGEGDAKYQAAARTLGAWMAEGVLAQEDAPSYTVVQEEFVAAGQPRRRTGLHAAVRIERYGEGAIYPHERTLSGPRTDRLNLMRATKAHFGVVFLLVDDADGEIRRALADVTERTPDHDIEGPDDARRRVWFERDATALERIARAMEGRAAVIADGHHRYETAMNYRDERAEAEGDAGEAAWVLAHLVPVEDPGLVVLPTHRLVKPKKSVTPEALKAALAGSFDLREVSPAEARAFTERAREHAEKIAFVVSTGPGQILLATLRDSSAMGSRAPDRSPSWRALDVAALHTLVIEDMLGVTADDVAAGGFVIYCQGAEDAIAAAESDGLVACLLRPTSAAEVLEVARSGERMPQKSTFFYPKVATGFAMRLV